MKNGHGTGGRKKTWLSRFIHRKWGGGGVVGGAQIGRAAKREGGLKSLTVVNALLKKACQRRARQKHAYFVEYRLSKKTGKEDTKFKERTNAPRYSDYYNGGDGGKSKKEKKVANIGDETAGGVNPDGLIRGLVVSSVQGGETRPREENTRPKNKEPHIYERKREQ